MEPVSRTPASANLVVVRGSTWEDEFTYLQPDGVTPVDLTGYEARMQVRTSEGRHGTTGAETVVMELTTNGVDKRLSWDTAATGRLRLLVSAEDTVDLNPSNAKKVKLFYGIEVFIPAGLEPEYVVPLAQGSISVRAEVVR